MLILYTCRVCETRSARTITKVAYTTGVVLVRCPGCENLHLIADRLGYFEDNDVDIEKLLAAKGETVVRAAVTDAAVNAVAAGARPGHGHSHSHGHGHAHAADGSCCGGGDHSHGTTTASGDAAAAAADSTSSSSSDAGVRIARIDPHVFEFSETDLAILRSAHKSVNLKTGEGVAQRVHEPKPVGYPIGDAAPASGSGTSS